MYCILLRVVSDPVVKDLRLEVPRIPAKGETLRLPNARQIEVRAVELRAVPLQSWHRPNNPAWNNTDRAADDYVDAWVTGAEVG